MESLKINAYAKINLTLNVGEISPNTYHYVESIIQRISLHDILHIYPLPEKEFILECTDKSIENESNILYKAYHAMNNIVGLPYGIKVRLKKNIPMQAGLGGGSADCAAFIIGVNELLNLKLPVSTMEEIGALLGSDVVACMYSLSFVTGTGELVRPLYAKMNYPILIIKQNFPCSTKEMYERLDGILHTIEQPNNNKAIINLLYKIDSINGLCGKFYNVFEEVVDHKNELIALRRALLSKNAIATHLCGSGSCIYSIFANDYDLEKAYNFIKSRYNYELYKAESMNILH